MLGLNRCPRVGNQNITDRAPGRMDVVSSYGALHATRQYTGCRAFNGAQYVCGVDDHRSHQHLHPQGECGQGEPPSVRPHRSMHYELAAFSAPMLVHDERR